MNDKGKTTFSFADIAQDTKFIHENKTFEAPTRIFTEKQRYNKVNILDIPSGLYVLLMLTIISGFLTYH